MQNACYVHAEKRDETAALYNRLATREDAVDVIDVTSDSTEDASRPGELLT